jgi:hypothetical protein
MARKSDPYFTDGADGDQPCSGDAHAAAVLAQGSNRSKKVAQSFGMKDQESAGQKYTGR